MSVPPPIPQQQQQQQQQQQLLLALDIKADQIHLALVQTTPPLSILCSTTIPVPSQTGILKDQPQPFQHRQNATSHIGQLHSSNPITTTTATAANPATGIAPIRAYLKALDEALDWLEQVKTDSQVSSSPDIIAISIASSPNLRVLTSSSARATLQHLCADRTLQSQLDLPTFLAHPHLLGDLVTPTAQDLQRFEDRLAINAGVQILDNGGNVVHRNASVSVDKLLSREKFRNAIARRLGGPIKVDGLPVLVATALSSSRRAATPLDWRQRDAFEALSQATGIMELGQMVACILTGDVVGPSVLEASLSGFFNVYTQDWDETLLAAVTGDHSVSESPLSFRTLKSALGEVNSSPLGSSLGHVSPWLANRCDLSASCVVMSPLPMELAEYFSFLPQEGDIGLQFGKSDYLVVPTWTRVVVPDAYTLPNPLSALRPLKAGVQSDQLDIFCKSTPACLVLVKADLAGEARKSIRNVYTNRNWDAFKRLMSAVCVGGSVGMDNKFYSICYCDGQQQSIKRYEVGIPVGEFSDLRANARCLVEGQALSMRSHVVNVLAQDRHNLLAAGQGDVPADRAVPSHIDFASGYHGAGAALGFDPFDETLTPSRVLATGKPAHNNSIAECYSAVLGGVWTTRKDEERSGDIAQPKESLQAKKIRGTSAALGAAYFTFAAIEARKAGEHGRSFSGFHACIIDGLKEAPSGPLPHSQASAVQRIGGSSAPLVAPTVPVKIASGQTAAKVPTGRRARSSSSPITTYMTSSSRRSTVSSASSSSSPFAIDTNSLILSPPSSSYLSSPLGTISGASKAMSTTVRSRTLSNLPAPLSQTFLDVLVEREEELTPRPYSQSISPRSSDSTAAQFQEHVHVAERTSGISERPKSLLERMSSAPNFSYSLAMTNVFQPVGIVNATATAPLASGRSRASSSASSWSGEGLLLPQSDSSEGLKHAATLSRGVQWSDSTGTGMGTGTGMEIGTGSGRSFTRSGSFSSSFSPEAEPFVSALSTPGATGTTGTGTAGKAILPMSRFRSRSIGTSALSGTTDSSRNRWPWAALTPVTVTTTMSAGETRRSCSPGTSTRQDYHISEHIHPDNSSEMSLWHVESTEMLSDSAGKAEVEYPRQQDRPASSAQSTGPSTGGGLRRTTSLTAAGPPKTMQPSSSRESRIEPLQEKAMRAWLLGQSSDPSRPDFRGDYGLQQEVGRPSRDDEDIGGGNDGQISDPLAFSLRSTSKRKVHSRTQAEQQQSMLSSHINAHRKEETRSLGHRSSDVEDLERSKRQCEELLGLQRGPMADMDVWAVYGALLEEYVRLKSTLA